MSTPELSPRIRAELGRHWTRAGLGEHASIASFARFTAQLLRFGAPASLVRDSLAATRDEVDHAERAFALATRYSAGPIDPGALTTHDAHAELDDLAAALRATVAEGCVAETLAAHDAALAAARADDPEVAATLEAIAEDEARHAALAWSFVGWALRHRPELRPDFEAALAEALAAVRLEPRPERFTAAERATLEAHGCPADTSRIRWRQRAIETIVLPCAAALGTSGHGPRSDALRDHPGVA